MNEQERKKVERQNLLDSAKEFETGLQQKRGAFKILMDIIEKKLEIVKRQEQILKDTSIKDIIKDINGFVNKRVELETRRKELEKLYNLPQYYIKQAEKIKNTPSADPGL